MTNLELQALRRLLFFTQAEAASMIGGVTERAWKHWEAGGRAVPADVAITIRMIADWREETINEFLEAIEVADDDDASDESQIGIVYYARAEDWHGEPLYWRAHQSMCAAAVAMHERAKLVPFDGPTYAAWLKGRKDSQVMRASWAGETIHAD